MMQHNLICSYLKIINMAITTYTWAVICLFPFTAKPHPTPLKKKKIINTVFIRRYILLVFSALFCSFIVCSFILSYSLFKMILILPLNMNMLTYINMHCISVAPKTESCQNPT